DRQSVAFGRLGQELPDAARAFGRDRQRVEAALDQGHGQQFDGNFLLDQNASERFAVLAVSGEREFWYHIGQRQVRRRRGVRRRPRAERGAFFSHQTKQLVNQRASLEGAGLSRDLLGFLQRF